MTDLKTKESLLDALRRAAAHSATAEELERQRVSFILGSLREESTVTRERVEEVLAEQGGRRARR